MRSKNVDIKHKQKNNKLEVKNKEGINQNIENNKKDNNELIENINSINQKDSSENESKGAKKESFQIISKINFNNKRIITIKELSKNHIGILFIDNLLTIYDSNTFTKINEIKIDINSSNNLEENDNKNRIINFIELKNSDLVFWTSQEIMFYKISEKGYISYQTINESIQEEKKDDDYMFFRMERYSYNNKDRYTINSISELKNGNLVSCNSYGIKIYTKKNDNYILLLKHELDIEVVNSTEIQLNKLVLMQINIRSGGYCSQTYYFHITYSLSIYDIENNKLTNNIYKFQENVNLRYNNISFFNNDKYLFVKYGAFKYGIYEINENMKSINDNNDIIESIPIREYYNFFRERCYNRIKDEMNIRFLCKYSKSLFFAADMNNGIKLYKFKDKSFELYEDIPNFPKDIIGMIKLQNNKIIMHSFDYLLVISNN